MGSSEGVLKTAAKRIGLEVNEYLNRVNAGLRYCYRCADWHVCAEFGRDASRTDGLAPACRLSTRAARRKAYQPKPRPAAGRRFVAPRNGDVKQARRRVNHLVDTGLIPDPNTLPCTDCGHVYAEGERRHEYDHHLGYGTDHHEDVEAVCTTCHHTREARRRDA